MEEDTSPSRQSAGMFTSQVSGPGLRCATVNIPTHVLVELYDSEGKPCQLSGQNITAQLKPSTSDAASRWPWSKRPPEASLTTVAAMSPYQYEISYTAVRRGRHKLHVEVNDGEIRGSPFSVIVYPDPTQLGYPVRVMTGLESPFGIGFSSHGDTIISEEMGYQISIFDSRGKKLRTFGTKERGRNQLIFPKGIVIGDEDYIYVCSDHQVEKFSITGELTKFVGSSEYRSRDDQLHEPHGITLHENRVYVCDYRNHRIQVFDKDLKFCRSIGSHGKENGQFNDPIDVKFDGDGNMYVADMTNARVQVMDSSGRFIRSFGQEGERKVVTPSALFIADSHVYVSDVGPGGVVVYTTSGQFVTSFGNEGKKKGQFHIPLFIAACANGFIHVCDHSNKRVQIF